MMPVLSGAIGTSGIALAAAGASSGGDRKAAAIRLCIENLPWLGWMKGVASAAGKGDAGAHFGDRLIDQRQSAFAVTALVRRRPRKLAPRLLQKPEGLAHMRLRADGVADAQASGDGGAQQNGAGVGCRHVVVSFDGFFSKSRGGAGP